MYSNNINIHNFESFTRICPGKELADNSLFIAVAMSAAVFNIGKAKDQYGNEIEPVHDYVSGVIR